MNVLTVEHIAKSYGEITLFEGISFSIHQGQKVALVAKNGTGKTSILDIIAQLEKPDKGEIVYRKGLQIAYLQQDMPLNPSATIEEIILSASNKILDVIANYHKALLNIDDQDAYQKAYDAMDQHEAWDYETQYAQILSKLDLNDLNQKVDELSGGQKKRLSLALTLLQYPDFLILDEPTNHLDLEMIEWLQEFLIQSGVTLFMVTHDRYFLENVCDAILELDQGKLYSYVGNYSYFLEKKEARLLEEATTLSKAKQLYKKELSWMSRQPKARTTKSKSRIDDFHEIKAKAHQRRQEHQVQLELNMERLGSKILEFHKVSKQFDDQLILKGFEYVFKKGERVGIIGKNGSGKSTFLNLITNAQKPDSGKIVVGETVKFGYYTQKGISIKQGQKVIDVVKEFGEYISLKKGRKISAQQLLERFLFDRKKQYDFVEKLSGGERKRLYLCTVLIQNPNFLILDEPTNDLDIVTLNVLENFLLDFPGCLIVVSHDRYFMDKIVDHLFVFKGNGVISDFPGNYTDYRVYESSTPKEIKTEKTTESKKDWKADDTSRLTFNEQKELRQLESKLKSLEYDKNELKAKFNDISLTPDEINELSSALETLITTIETKELRWMELVEKLEG